MVVLTANQLLSNQAYSDHFNRKRLIGIEEDDKDITHYINFELDEHLLLVASVKHRLENPKIPDKITVKEHQILYLSDKALGSSAAVPLSESPQRWEIISKIAQRTVVVIGIEIDQKFYAKLNNSSKSICSLVNNTYILIAPAPQVKTIPPCEPPSSTESEENSQQSREDTAMDKKPSVSPRYELKLHLSLTPDGN